MAVKINGTVISDKEVSDEYSRMVEQLAARIPPQQLEPMQDAIKKQAVENIINRALLEQAIEREGITASQEEIDSRMDAIKSNFGSDSAFSERLATMGITAKELRQEMGAALRMEKLIDKHVGEIEEPTETELRSFYDENSERFVQPERVRASHILIKTGAGETDPEKAAKRLEAAKILGRIGEGADFAELASRHSECPSKAKGGDVGFFERGRMVKPFEDAAFTLGVGEVSDLVETQFGYHIVKVTDRQEKSSIPYETAKDDIATFLGSHKRQEAINVYTSKLRSAATIEYSESGPRGNGAEQRPDH
jgi:peptidyl-prolyl cis-trans isomerase C